MSCVTRDVDTVFAYFREPCCSTRSFYILFVGNAFYIMCETTVFVVYHTFFFAYPATNILIRDLQSQQ